MPTRLLFVILLFISASYGYGQRQRTQDSYEAPEVEVNLWSQDGGNLAPWIFYTGKEMTAELRYNWDDKGVYGACLGKAFGKKSLTLIPEACGYSGKFSGYGPELWVLSETRRYSVISYVQYAKMLRTTSYGYMWFQSEVKIGKRLGLGLGAQSLRDGGSPFSADLGLSTKLRFGKWYVNFVPLWRVTPEGRGSFTNYAGVGYVF